MDLELGGRGGANVRPGGGNNGSTLFVNGTVCGQATECQSGWCVDGRCCDSACNGVCRACNLPGTEGRCSPVPKEQDPADECAPEPASTCGRDGFCDGASACRLHVAGVMCGPGSCADATQRAASVCDGAGVCQLGAPKSCAPAICIGESCGDPCIANTDCQTGFFCDANTCRVKRVVAGACETDEQCMSGFCADGACCATACKEKCHSCKVEGAVGTCTPTVAGMDPRNECQVQGIITCGNAGGCDGKGACRLHTAGTFCAPASCSGSTVTAISTCDGLGACKPGPKSDCGNFVCNGASCWTACATRDQCKADRNCVINTCR